MSSRARRAGRRRLLSLSASVLILGGLLPAAAAAPVLAAPTDLFISEYVEGTSNNKAVEIYNGTGAPVDLAGYTLEMFFNANTTAGLSIPLAGTLDNADVWVVVNSGATPALLAIASQLNGSAWFNGNDSVALVKNGTRIDVLGQIGGNPTTEWGTGLVSTADNTLRRKPTIETGDPNGDDAFDPSAQWNGFATDTFDGLGAHSITTDPAPFVSSTTPLNGATGVPISTTTVSVTFSEPVALGAGAVSLSCTNQGPKVLGIIVGSGPTVFSYTTGQFLNGDHCTFLVDAAAVTDLDLDDPPDTMAANYTASFDTVAAATNALVINELDYDQPGTDGAEFVELKNTSSSPINLDSYLVQFINGGLALPASYASFDLPNVDLAPGDWFVICANASTVANCDLDGNPDTNFIQNGPPDAIALRLSGTLVDVLSYAGSTAAPFTETAGAGTDTPTDGVVQGLSRCPDGTDTNNNSTDFLLRTSTPGVRNTCPGDDTAPSVFTTFPINGATDVNVSANLSVTFSEPVTATDPWFTLTCNTIAKPATYAGGPTTFTIDPVSDFVDGDVCQLTVIAANIADQDAIDPPDNMTVNFVVGFTAQDVCLDPFTPIFTIQGSGASTPIPGLQTTQGVVVGDFEGPIASGIQGFYLQDATGDGDTATSDGIFVFTGNADNGVAEGDVVRVTGFARERFNQTSLNGAIDDNNAPVTNIAQCGTGSVSPTDVTLPFETLSSPEIHEGMLVRLPQALVISEYFNYARFGEMVLAQPLNDEERPFTPTAIDEPGAPAQARAAANALARITLDDGLGAQNPPSVRHPNGEPFSLTNRFRGGDTVANTVGVLGFDFGLYRIQPTEAADYASVNPRSDAPEEVGGTLRAAAMNTLNFFLTLDTTANDSGPGPCGGNANLDCRGADSDQPDEFTRQRDKLLQALAGLDADVIGLNEIENTPGVEPLLDPDRGIVAGLNGLPGVGPYAAIDTGVIGTDAIRVGLIYRTDSVAPVGDFQILDSTVDPRFIDTRSRPVLAQTFEDLATGARFTVAVNHLKSKGSACAGDPDDGDGQGNCNGTRTLAAQALVDWLATDPTGSGDRDYLILGDLNSYAKEDPIDAILAGSDDTAGTADDYTNLIAKYQGPFAHSYVFDGQAGYLDHALASPTLVAQVTGATDWHINSDEPNLLDYDTSFKPPEQEAIFNVDAYRTSDHDPVVVGLDLLNYEFEGFEAPVDNPPVINQVKAGQGVPVKFDLADGLGLDVLFGTPTAIQFPCEGGAASDDVETTTSGSSGLQLDPVTGLYTYVWKTDKAWANQCRTFEITFDDGAYRRALFTFTK